MTDDLALRRLAQGVSGHFERERRGERCEVSVRLISENCSDHSSGEGNVPLVRGVHPSDRERARRSAWEKVTPGAVETAVRDALKSALQIGE